MVVLRAKRRQLDTRALVMSYYESDGRMRRVGLLGTGEERARWEGCSPKRLCGSKASSGGEGGASELLVEVQRRN